MKAFDRACIYILVLLSVLIVCAFVRTNEAAVVAISSTAVCFVLLVYENRICYYEHKAERYRKLFKEQSKQYLKYVCNNIEERHSNAKITKICRGQKSGVDNSKVS